MHEGIRLPKSAELNKDRFLTKLTGDVGVETFFSLPMSVEHQQEETLCCNMSHIWRGFPGAMKGVWIKVNYVCLLTVWLWMEHAGPFTLGFYRKF